MAKHKVTLRARGEEVVEEVELEFPFYGVSYHEWGTMYTKCVSPEKEVCVTERINCMAENGYRHNDEYEIEVRKPCFSTSNTMQKLKQEMEDDATTEAEFNAVVQRMTAFIYKHSMGDGE